MSRAALVVGIDAYVSFGSLPSCASDARAVSERIARNADGSPNYDTVTLIAEGTGSITRGEVRGALDGLFTCPGEVLFYFSGHGAIESSGGWLATSEGTLHDIGLNLDEVLARVNDANRRPRDVTIILDTCYSGCLGNSSASGDASSNRAIASLRENTTLIAASRGDETAQAGSSYSKFTEVLLDALDGGAADHMGFVTGTSIYGYVERRFGAWAQRPVFKSNLAEVPTIRKCAPLIEPHKLRNLTDLFRDPHYQYPLDPDYEPQDRDGSLPVAFDPDKYDKSRLLKELRDVGLVKASVLGEDFYYAARNSSTVELTLRGKEYWYLVKGNRI